MNIEKVSKELYEVLVVTTEGEARLMVPQHRDPGRHPGLALVVPALQPQDIRESPEDAPGSHAPEAGEGHGGAHIAHR